MKCPICNEEMQEGGIVANGVAVSWNNKDEFEKKRKFVLKVGKRIGKPNYLLGITRIEEAYWCEKCNKVMGIFDVVED